MPPVCKYYGIIIIINNGREHNPPHIHLTFQDFDVSIEIKSGEYAKGSRKLPKFAQEWLKNNRQAAMEQWKRMEKGEKIQFIGP